MTEKHHIVKVEFTRFKAFSRFILYVNKFNILVGPNNAGKSTILAAFRILAAGLRKAFSRNPIFVDGPRSKSRGYSIDLKSISVASENIFHNYDDAEPASIKFSLSNGNSLLLFFPEKGVCNLLPITTGRVVTSTTTFKHAFNCKIGFVPILGPVDHNEELYKEDAARNALYNYTAARNFRNIWYHYQEKFSFFRDLLQRTWPGMDIEKPAIEYDGASSRLFMFCPEGRIPREIFWAGFGFQVWCQMLTHLVHAEDCSLFLIDEPDIYLHAELQRQLLSILRDLGPDVIIATHSTEIICDAEPQELVLIDKKRLHGKRLKNTHELASLFITLGAATNPTLTQLAKTRKVIFVEGKDFNILSKFAHRLGFRNIANRSSFAVIPIEGFNPERIKSLVSGIEMTLGFKVECGAIMDRDYRCSHECDAVVDGLRKCCDFVIIHKRKEIENYLLIPDAIEKAVKARLIEKERRGEKIAQNIDMNISSELNDILQSMKRRVFGQISASWKDYRKRENPRLSESTMLDEIYSEFDLIWNDITQRIGCVPGKDVLSEMNQRLQRKFGVSISVNAIIEKMHKHDIPEDIFELMNRIEKFATMQFNDDNNAVD